MLVQSWDTAIKGGNQHDASACATLHYDGSHHYLMDMQVVRLEYPALKRFILSHAERYCPDRILMEDKASGQSLLQDLRTECAFPMLGIHPKGDKTMRLARASVLMETGRIKLPFHASWLGAFEAEIMAFPNAAHDDQVDAFTQYCCWFLDHQLGRNATIRRL